MLEVTCSSPRTLLEFKYDPVTGLVQAYSIQELPIAQSEFMEVLSDGSALLAV
jgi:hypothetical protein